MLKQKSSVWIVHNGRRFHAIFMLGYLLVERNITPESVMNGNQILALAINEIYWKMINSYSFLNMPLSKLPEAVGIKDLQKNIILMVLLI